MSWTDPTQRTTGTLITASIYNTDIVDNLVNLRDRNFTPELVSFDFILDVETGDGKNYLHITPDLGGTDLVYVHHRVITAGITGTTDVQVHNVTDAVDMLTTKVTINSGDTGSEDGTPAVIDTTNDDVAENDLLRLDFDAVSTTPPKGSIFTLGFQYP